jgi:hypothetical protein
VIQDSFRGICEGKYNSARRALASVMESSLLDARLTPNVESDRVASVFDSFLEKITEGAIAHELWLSAGLPEAQPRFISAVFRRLFDTALGTPEP